jgi:hypothetical protein
MIADPDEPKLSQVIGYLGVEATDCSLPEWRRSRATVLVAYIEQANAALEEIASGLSVRHPFDIANEALGRAVTS